MPDYEIRFFHADGALAVVHMSHHHSDEEALSHARRLIGEHASMKSAAATAPWRPRGASCRR